MRRLPVLALLAAAAFLPLAPSASAACPRDVQSPSVTTVGGVHVGGPYTEACGATCARLVTTPPASVPGVVELGSGYVNSCT